MTEMSTAKCRLKAVMTLLEAVFVLYIFVTAVAVVLWRHQLVRAFWVGITIGVAYTVFIWLVYKRFSLADGEPERVQPQEEA